MAYGTIKVDTITFTDAGVDKSVTISGLVQNPTFSGNITVTGTVSGNTIQGQTVSGATITGGAAAFTTVTGGVATITSGVFALGSASNPSISFNGDANSGLYSPGADQVAISTGGSGRLFVGSTGTSALSLNTAAGVPVAISSSTDGEQFRIRRVGGTYNPGLLVGLSDTVSNEIIFNSTYSAGTAPSYVWQDAGNERMRLTGSGRLGVGTSSPSYKFEVDNSGGSTATARLVGNDQANARLRIQNTGTGGRAYEIVGGLDGANNSHLSIYDATAAATRLTITETGLVGVGTSVPGDVLDTAAGNYRGITIKCATTAHRPTLSFFNTADSLAAYIQAIGESLVFGSMVTDYGGHTPRMTLTSTGLGIGTTSPAAKLHVDDGTGCALFVGLSSNIYYRAFEHIFQGQNGTNERLRIDSSGNVGIGTSSPASKLSLSLTGISTGKTDGNNWGANGVLQIGNSDGGTANSEVLIVGSQTGADGPGVGQIASAIGFGRGTSGWGTYLNFYTHSDSTANIDELIERVRIDSSGNVGVGTTSPNGLLDVRSATTWIGDGTTDAFLQFNQSATAANRWHIGTGSGNALIFYKGTYGSGSETARIDSSGRLLVGTSSARATGSGSGIDLQVEGTPSPCNIGAIRNSNNAFPARIAIAKTRGTSVGSNTIVQSGDSLGLLEFDGADGTQLLPGAYIEAVVDGTPGVNDLPTRLVFSTTADGASSPTERLRITSAGRVGIGTSAPTENLTVSDAIATLPVSYNAAAEILNFKSLTLGAISSTNQLRITFTLPTNITGYEGFFVAELLVKASFDNVSFPGLGGIYKIRVGGVSSGTGTATSFLTAEVLYTAATSGNWAAITTGDIAVNAVSGTELTLDIDNPGGFDYRYNVFTQYAHNCSNIALSSVAA